MTDIVQAINDGITARLVVVLPSTFVEFKYVLDVDKNSFSGEEKRFGVRPLSAASTPGVNKSVNLKQQFEIILSDFYNNEEDDNAQRTKTFELYDQMDEILGDLMGQKAGIPDKITLINEPVILEPEYPSSKSVILRGQIDVTYRRST